MTKIDLKSLEKERLSNSESKNIYGGDLSKDINNGIGEAVYDEDAQAELNIGRTRVEVLQDPSKPLGLTVCASRCANEPRTNTSHNSRDAQFYSSRDN